MVTDTLAVISTRFIAAIYQGSMGVRTDEELARSVQQGHRDDLTPLIERHHSPLLGYLYRLTGGDRALAEDLAQETFLRVLRSLRQYRTSQRFKPWLYAIATNLARDHFKRADTRHTNNELTEDLIDRGASPDEVVLTRDNAARITAAIKALPMTQREVVVLRYYEDWPLADIAAALNIPVGTVKSRLSIALQRLRSLME
jgi:RNA polymerase sigma-70 factor (ECF subfamily)